MKDAVLATKTVVVYHVEWVLGTLQPLELCSVSVCGGLALCTLHTLEGTQVFSLNEKTSTTEKQHRQCWTERKTHSRPSGDEWTQNNFFWKHWASGSGGQRWDSATSSTCWAFRIQESLGVCLAHPPHCQQADEHSSYSWELPLSALIGMIYRKQVTRLNKHPARL